MSGREPITSLASGMIGVLSSAIASDWRKPLVLLARLVNQRGSLTLGVRAGLLSACCCSVMSAITPSQLVDPSGVALGHRLRPESHLIRPSPNLSHPPS